MKVKSSPEILTMQDPVIRYCIGAKITITIWNRYIDIKVIIFPPPHFSIKVAFDPTS